MRVETPEIPPPSEDRSCEGVRTEDELSHPHLLEELVDALGRSGVVRQVPMLVALLLVFVSRLCRNPLNVSSGGLPGVGKSFLVCRVCRLFRGSAFVSAYFSKTSLVHDTDWAEVRDDGSYVIDLRGKVIVLLEAAASRKFLELMKPIRSHDMDEVSFYITQSTKGEHRTKKVVLKGWPVFVDLSVNPSCDGEDTSRELRLTPSYSEQHGKEVNMQRGMRAATPWNFLSGAKTDGMLSTWEDTLAELKPMMVVNLFAPALANEFDTKGARSMRDFEKVLSLLESCAILHQRQRVIVETAEKRYVVASVDDLKITCRVAEELIGQTVTGLGADVIHAHADFFARVCPQGVGKTIEEIRAEWTKGHGKPISRSTLLGHYLGPLHEAGYMVRDDSQKAHKWSVSSAKLSTSVGIDFDRLENDIIRNAGIDDHVSDLVSSVNVSRVTFGREEIPTGDKTLLSNRIVSALNASTVRQEFLDKLGDPMASCYISENEKSVESNAAGADRPGPGPQVPMDFQTGEGAQE